MGGSEMFVSGKGVVEKERPEKIFASNRPLNSLSPLGRG